MAAAAAFLQNKHLIRGAFSVIIGGEICCDDTSLGRHHTHSPNITHTLSSTQSTLVLLWIVDYEWSHYKVMKIIFMHMKEYVIDATQHWPY